MVERYEKMSASVSIISTCIQKIEAEQMTKYGLKGSCAQYLAAMRKNEEGVTVSRLSEICAKDKAAVSRAVAELESKGFVSRAASGGNMYRALVTLTPKGKEVAEFVANRASTAVELAGKGLTDEERAIMYDALGLISANLTEICKQGLPNINAD